jgi:hypothetical protein
LVFRTSDTEKTKQIIKEKGLQQFWYKTQLCSFYHELRELRIIL